MSQQKQELEAPEIYREYIKKMVDEITDANDLRRIYTLVSVKYEKICSGGVSA